MFLLLLSRLSLALITHTPYCNGATIAHDRQYAMSKEDNPTAFVGIRIPEGEKARWREAADAEKRNLTSFVRAACDERAERMERERRAKAVA